MNKTVWKTTPFPFQGIGIFRLDTRFKGRAVLADDIGLGKSIQSLYAALPYRRKRPIIVISPSPVKLGWEEQIKSHTALSSFILYGRNPNIEVPKADVYIINWEILQYWIFRIKKMKPSILIGDEIHNAKNSRSKRTKALRFICKGIPFIYFLSGTPIENNPTEFFVPINILRPDLFPDFKRFAYRYSKPKFTHWGVRFEGAQNTRELRRLLKQNLMVRRTTNQVFKDLPPVSRSVLPVEINRREYNKAVKDIKAWIIQNKPDKAYMAKSAVGQSKLNHLLQIIASLKFKPIVDWINNFLETTDKKLTVFAHHRKLLEQLHDKFKKQSTLVYGGIGHKRRKEAIRKFVHDPSTRIFFGGITAVGTGVNDLQLVCSDMAIVELWWVGLKLLQVEGRLKRIGQRFKVNVTYIVAENTEEYKLAKSIIRKQKDINAIMDGRYGKKHEFDIFSNVMSGIMGRRK